MSPCSYLEQRLNSNSRDAPSQATVLLELCLQQYYVHDLFSFMIPLRLLIRRQYALSQDLVNKEFPIREVDP